MPASQQHAVVVGTSIAGILAARALTEHFDRVTLVDRDEMPAEPANRGGTPHSRHVHGLLSRGRAVMEAMFPGMCEDLVARGALLGDAQEGGHYVLGGCRLAPGTAGLPTLAVSRPLLEWYLRRRLLLESRVTLREHTSALDLTFTADERRVNGVVVTHRDGGPPELLPADLVVDASGRGSRTPEWLERRGFPAPVEDVRRVDKQYATREFRRTDEPGQPVVRVVAATPDHPRGGIILANEGGRWAVSLSGMHGERPPLDLDGYLEWARSLVAPDVADALMGLEPLDEGARYRFPANRRRHYEHLTRFPDGIVVIGDALCAFDPVFGQGMTVAAVEAEELGRCLAERGTEELARRFHRRAAEHIDTPWMIAAGGALAADAHRPLGERLVEGYVARLVRAGAADAVLATAFLRVQHLVDRPQDLMRPRLAARVLRGSLPRRTAGSGRTAAAPARAERAVVGPS